LGGGGGGVVVGGGGGGGGVVVALCFFFWKKYGCPPPPPAPSRQMEALLDAVVATIASSPPDRVSGSPWRPPWRGSADGVSLTPLGGGILNSTFALDGEGHPPLPPSPAHPPQPRRGVCFHSLQAGWIPTHGAW
jgi:hypothetical protein